MRSRVIIALVAGAAMVLIARGCLTRKDNTEPKVETANATANAKAQPAEFPLSAKDDEGVDLPEREELRQSRKLTPGTKVFVIGLNGQVRVDSDNKQAFVMGVNGGVKVETADTDIAEVLIVRSARTREDLRHRRVKIGDDKDLFIHIEDDPALGPVPENRERVILRLPRKTNLEIHVVYGAVTVGETEGRLEVRNVDGGVRIARAAGPVVIRQVNGGVDLTFAPLPANSLRIGDNINGDVELRFDGEAHANLDAWRVNGTIKPDLPNVEIRESASGWGRLKASIGKGGLGIEVAHVNGNVTLSKAASKETATLKTAAK